MKKHLFIYSIFILSHFIFAQPVIQNGNNIPSVGFSAAVTATSPTSVGDPGANQVWDFSSLSFISAGTLKLLLLLQLLLLHLSLQQIMHIP